MLSLVRQYGLYYLIAAGTFFFLCAYSLVAKAPNFPFLPAMFLPVYLSGAMATSESNTGKPLLSIMPVTIADIMKVKFGLALVFVVVSWYHMALFTYLQGLGSELTWQVLKLNTICSINTLLLAAFFQLGIHFFGRSIFQKVILSFCIGGAVFCIVFLIGLAESGHNHPGKFPLIPFLDSMPSLVIVGGILIALALFYLLLQRAPWGLEEEIG